MFRILQNSVRVPAFILATITAVSCIRLAPRSTVEEPAAVLERHVFAAGLAKTGDWAEPRDEKDVFDKGKDASVFSFLSLKNLQDAHTLAWKWYDPSGRLYRAADPIGIGRPGQLFARYIAWDEIKLFAEKDSGHWTVALYLDGDLALTQSFEIK